MFEAYHDVPKFAFLNAMAAHVYKAFDLMPMAAEAYDLVLAAFLERILQRSDADNTIIVVRSDASVFLIHWFRLSMWCWNKDCLRMSLQ